MPDVLGFNPHRNLGFDPKRDLGFDPGRGLGFDPSRDLGFQIGRDLGFGKRGPVFRGFVCPICGAQVTADQPSCTECGAVFDEKGGGEKAAPTPSSTRAPDPPRITPPPAQQARPPPPTRSFPPPAKRIDSTFCIFCGARLASNDTFCWQCGKPVSGTRTP